MAHDPYLRRFAMYGALANLAYAGNLALVVLYLVRVVRLDPAAAGLLIATSGAGGMLGTLAARPLARRLGTARALVVTALGTGLSSRVTASMGFLVQGTVPLGGLLAGLLGTVLGIRDGLWAMLSVFAASSLLLTARRVRSFRDLPERSTALSQ